jgi:catechol 2,3-dioxygenase-like lactoylglutathione lyase family enzyme
MHVQRLDHVTINTYDLDATRRFYVDVIGLHNGERPPFAFPGLWLYIGQTAVIHVVGLSTDDDRLPGGGAVDHIAFRVDGLAAMRERLQRENIAASEAVVPRTGDVQIFVHDPNGVRLELNFTASPAELREALGLRA